MRSQRRTGLVAATFMMPFYKNEYGYIPTDTFSTAISRTDEKRYVTWFGSRGGRTGSGAACALAVIHDS